MQCCRTLLRDAVDRLYTFVSPPYPQRVVKGDLMGRFLGITVKKVEPCRCLYEHVKEPYGMSMALGAQT